MCILIGLGEAEARSRNEPFTEYNAHLNKNYSVLRFKIARFLRCIKYRHADSISLQKLVKTDHKIVQHFVRN